MSKTYFPNIDKIKFEGKGSKNPFAFKYYDENKIKIIEVLKINERGVWHRSSYIPFSPLKLLEWNKIDFVELNIVSYSKHRKGKGLIIYKKNSLSTKTIYLDDLDCPNEDILSIFKKHSNFLNYINRSEIKNTCRY